MPLSDRELEDLRDCVTFWRQLRRRAGAWSAAIAFIGFAAIPVVADDRLHLPRSAVGPPFLLFIGGMIAFLVVFVARPSEERLKGQLAKEDDAMSVGPLIEAHRMMLPAISEFALARLAERLPLVEQEDAETLSAYQHQVARQMLQATVFDPPTVPIPYWFPVGELARHAVARKRMRRQYGPRTEQQRDLCLGLLRLLGFIGNAEDLRVVRRVIETSARDPLCAAAIEARLARLTPAETLLRASAAPGESTLLRPTAPAPEQDAEVLLRPTTAPGD